MNNYDIVIIGGGVSGLTAGIYSARSNKKVLIIENNNIGGTTATLSMIENYPGVLTTTGFDLVSNLYTQANNFGVKFEFAQISQIDFENSCIYMLNNSVNDKITYNALIIACGTSVKKLNVEGEEKLFGHGVSYCAVCDGNLYKNKHVIVVTNNNSAMSDVIHLINLTNNITVLDISNGFSYEGIEIYHNIKPIKICGDSKFDNIIFDKDGIETQIYGDAIFVELGRCVDLHLFENTINIDNGYIVSDEHMHTNINNVFVAGDIRKKDLRQIITACSDGAIAGVEAVKYINKKANID